MLLSNAVCHVGTPLEKERTWRSQVARAAYFASVEVLDDGEVQVFLALPFCLHGVGQELPEGPVRPLQQLIIQQEGVGGLCMPGERTERQSGLRTIMDGFPNSKLSSEFHNVAEKMSATQEGTS